MPNIREEFRNQFARRAIVMEIGGFRPSDNITASWFGRVNMRSYDEQWPRHEGKFMLPLAQINLSELPFRTPGVEDIEFITLFISPHTLPLRDDQNGTTWELRAYRTVADLIPLAQPEVSSLIRPFQMRPKIIENDYPCFDDAPIHLKQSLWEAYQSNRFKNAGGFKFGGWPTLIQSEIDWGSPYRQSIQPEYIFQIDSTEKGNWSWGDNGVAYFGRVLNDGMGDKWVLEWQSL